MEPNCKCLGDGDFEMYGIKFKHIEGSFEGFLPIKKVAENNNVSVEDITNCLKKYDLLDEKGEPSQTEHHVEGLDWENTAWGKNEIPLFCLIMLYRVGRQAQGDEKGDKTGYMDLGTYVHEQFIGELIKL